MTSRFQKTKLFECTPDEDENGCFGLFVVVWQFIPDWKIYKAESDEERLAREATLPQWAVEEGADDRGEADESK
jgi:hypothetical protein